jgi:hypothetical protein
MTPVSPPTGRPPLLELPKMHSRGLPQFPRPLPRRRDHGPLHWTGACRRRCSLDEEQGSSDAQLSVVPFLHPAVEEIAIFL